jgi:hypothetical protein
MINHGIVPESDSPFVPDRSRGGYQQVWAVNQYERRKCVYFIAEGPRGAIKIGVTDDPAKRLAALQIGNSRPLRCLGLIDGDAYVESKWHRRFAAQRISGEWFKRTPELVAAIKAERTHTLLTHPRDGRTTRLERIIAVQPSQPPITQDYNWYRCNRHGWICLGHPCPSCTKEKVR